MYDITSISKIHATGTTWGAGGSGKTSGRRGQQKDVNVTEASGVNGGSEAPSQIINHLSSLAATPQ